MGKNENIYIKKKKKKRIFLFEDSIARCQGGKPSIFSCLVTKKIVEMPFFEQHSFKKME